MINALPWASYQGFNVEQSTSNEMTWNKFDTFRKTMCNSLYKTVAPLLMKLKFDFMVSYYNTAKLY